MKSTMNIAVYTDGACSNNGAKGAKAGIGIYFGEQDPRNVSRRITGKQTNNTAELTAILTVATILRREILAGYPICIYSDSQYAIRCCTSYGKKLAAKHWKNGKKVIPNLELVQQAYAAYKDIGNVEFIYVPAHTGLQDEHSKGNEGADRLANKAIGHTSCMYHTPKKLYLHVPYAQKDEAKALGARWDPKKKKWYIPNQCPHQDALLARWSREIK